MRRALYWYLPLAVTLFACLVFAGGFYSFLRGDIGTPVGAVMSYVHAAPPRTALAPLVLGDSLGRGTGDQSGLGIGGRLVQDLRAEHRNVRPVVNLAVNGARTRDLLAQLQSRNVRTLIAQSNVIVISIGGNDLWGTTDLRNGPLFDPEKVMESVLDRVAVIVTDVRAANPTARIFIIGLYNPLATVAAGGRLTPLVNRWNAKLLERFAKDSNLTVVPTSDIFSHRDRLSFDRFHPDDEGYALIARRIAESL
jgi:lysophospholipase L1-like esterase